MKTMVSMSRIVGICISFVKMVMTMLMSWMMLSMSMDVTMIMAHDHSNKDNNTKLEKKLIWWFLSSLFTQFYQKFLHLVLKAEMWSVNAPWAMCNKLASVKIMSKFLYPPRSFTSLSLLSTGPTEKGVWNGNLKL